jgi:hypothetical protein
MCFWTLYRISFSFSRGLFRSFVEWGSRGWGIHFPLAGTNVRMGRRADIVL